MTSSSDQELLMRGLAILQTLEYENPAAQPSNKPDRAASTSADVRMLDVIAAGLATGEGGDVAAAAFVERSLYEHKVGPISADDDAKTFILLAKNKIPSPEDKEAATKLFDAINNPGTKDLFPTLLKLCGKNMKNRVKSLIKVLEDSKLQNFVETRLKKYPTQGLVGSASLFDFKKEFPSSEAVSIIPKLMEEHSPRSFTALWDALTDFIIISGRAFLDAKGIKKSQSAYEVLSLATYTMLKSAFVKRSLLAETESTRLNELALTLKRRLSKINLYTRSAGFLLAQIASKNMRPVKYFWVEESPTGAGVTYGPFNPEFKEEFRDVSRRLGLSDEEKKTLTFQLFIRNKSLSGRFQNNWFEINTIRDRMPKTFEAYFHSELRILWYMERFAESHNSVKTWPTPNEAIRNQSLSKGSQERQIVPIGVSKNSCIMCKWFLDKHNGEKHNRKYMTSGDHGKPYARWFHLRTVYTTEVLSDLKHHIIAAAQDWTSAGKKRVISDEYLSSSSDDRKPGETRHAVASNQRLVEQFIRNIG